MRDSQAKPARALIVCSLWLRIGFVGASVLAAGLLKLWDGGWTWVWALPLAIAGGVLTAASWRRGRIALDHAEWASATSAGETVASTVSAHPPQTGRGATPVASNSAAIQSQARSCA
jgi:K+ transporter